MKKTQLQELNWKHFWHHVKHDAKAYVHGVEGRAKIAEGFMKMDQLQELNWFTHAAHSVEHETTHLVHAATPDLKWAAGKAWKGTKWCYADATCKANVEKYGLAATEAAFALQVIILI